MTKGEKEYRRMKKHNILDSTQNANVVVPIFIILNVLKK
jgi:hypothetical protein